MIILEKPYVSDFLINTIKENNFCVLDSEISRKFLDQKYLISTNNAKERYNKSNELIYTNSENSIDWIKENLKNSQLSNLITLSKDKAKFRSAIKKLYPNYFFKEVTKKELFETDLKTLKFPLVLKPSVGFLSFGVYSIENENDFRKTLENLDSDIEKFKNIFPKSVVDCQKFLIEEMIEGKEYALDAYFNKEGKAVILNIFEHPFFDSKDVSDRAYFTNKEIITKYLDKFKSMLDKIAIAGNYSNFPFHLELRVSDKGIIPIEINPMRFCGWCITDIAYFAWGINVYDYYFNQKTPDWENILKDKDNSYYYFTIGDIPSKINKSKIKSVDYQKYLKYISNPLDIRKIDYKNNPVFAIVFAKCDNIDEIKTILKLNMSEFIEM